MITYKAILGSASIALTLLAFIPYIRAIHKGQVVPHLFSWIIWGTTTLTVFFAQHHDHGGAGAWPTGVSGLITLYIAYLAYRKRSRHTISSADKWFLALALSTWPLWYMTSDPIWAVVILTAVDLLGFGPTLRKAYLVPFEESLTFFALFIARNVLALFALTHYSVTTVLFPLAVTLACLILSITVLYRRHHITP
ncbi:MAG TPA: hypothetical protein DIT58_10830 [Porticoccaceae bacterium]|nr:hypothetical protein [Porticoccaceae bacterium]